MCCCCFKCPNSKYWLLVHVSLGTHYTLYLGPEILTYFHNYSDIFNIKTTLYGEFPLWFSRLRTRLVIHEDAGFIPGLPQCAKRSSVTGNWGVGCRCCSALVLLWLWYRLVVTAPIWSLAWELPHATVAALKKKKKKNVSIFTFSLVFSWRFGSEYLDHHS